MAELMTTSAASLLSKISETSSLEEMKQTIKKIDALKIALESVDAFRAQSILYARLEAEALLRVVDLGGIKQLKGDHRKTAEWLSSLSESERNKYIGMCEDGLTIDQVYKREIYWPMKYDQHIREAMEARSGLVSDLKENGYVDMSSFVWLTGNLDSELRKDIIDGARDKLRDAGGVCVEAGSHIYVVPAPDRTEETRKAILLRYKSAVRDIERMVAISKASGVKVDSDELLEEFTYNFESCPTHFGLLLTLDTLGVLSGGAYLGAFENDKNRIREKCGCCVEV